MYKKGDVVIIQSIAGPAIPQVKARLIERVVVKPQKGRTFDWPGYVGWICVLTKQKEVDMLRKKWSIPFEWPDKVETFTFEKNIVKNVSTGSKRRRVNKNKK